MKFEYVVVCKKSRRGSILSTVRSIHVKVTTGLKPSFYLPQYKLSVPIS